MVALKSAIRDELCTNDREQGGCNSSPFPKFESFVGGEAVIVKVTLKYVPVATLTTACRAEESNKCADRIHAFVWDKASFN